MSEPTTVDVSKHKLVVDPVGVIAEIISNITDERDVLRELLSNAAATEVKAEHITVSVYESDKGLSFTVQDDGVGMSYTKNEEKPGRLDKFLNVAQGKQGGFESDEFGAKGFGTKLLYNSKEVEVETWDGGPWTYRVILDNPRHAVLDEKKLVQPVIHKFTPHPSVTKGTKITLKGWNNRQSIPKEFKMDSLTNYLVYQTVAGYTRKRSSPLPQIVLKVGGTPVTIETGFRYISPSDESGDEVRTVTFGPIEKSRKTLEGKMVKMVLRGGVTVDTGKFGLSESTGGVWISSKGIPYFQLRANKYAKRLGMSDDFIRFVAECDDVRLNLGRSDFSFDESYDAFDAALGEAFDQIRGTKEFETFYKNKRKQFKIMSQQKMTAKKKEFLSETKRFVWHNGRKLLTEPESEQDTAALLWILEGANATPFTHFRTLQYPGYGSGIDLLVDIQEEKEAQMQVFVYAEIERRFSNLISHKHDISQMTYVFCWDVDKGHVQIGNIDSTKKPYKYIYKLSDHYVTVFELKNFPGIYVGSSPPNSSQDD